MNSAHAPINRSVLGTDRKVFVSNIIFEQNSVDFKNVFSILNSGQQLIRMAPKE